MSDGLGIFAAQALRLNREGAKSAKKDAKEYERETRISQIAQIQTEGEMRRFQSVKSAQSLSISSFSPGATIRYFGSCRRCAHGTTVSTRSWHPAARTLRLNREGAKSAKKDAKKNDSTRISPIAQIQAEGEMRRFQSVKSAQSLSMSSSSPSRPGFARVRLRLTLFAAFAFKNRMTEGACP